MERNVDSNLIQSVLGMFTLSEPTSEWCCSDFNRLLNSTSEWCCSDFNRLLNSTSEWCCSDFNRLLNSTSGGVLTLKDFKN
ncbi:hypothetical protein BgiMline_011007 [Biomphalaria glabrata]|nr:hypothetical protein BgiMline_026978 [Biomphalaria glabrata]